MPDGRLVVAVAGGAVEVVGLDVVLVEELARPVVVVTRIAAAGLEVVAGPAVVAVPAELDDDAAPVVAGVARMVTPVDDDPEVELAPSSESVAAALPVVGTGLAATARDEDGVEPAATSDPPLPSPEAVSSASSAVWARAVSGAAASWEAPSSAPQAAATVTNASTAIVHARFVLMGCILRSTRTRPVA